jgi:hypothetical protein
MPRSLLQAQDRRLHLFRHRSKLHQVLTRRLPRSLVSLGGFGEVSGSRCVYTLCAFNSALNVLIFIFFFLLKKGEDAIQAARKDLGDYVSQAQQGLNKQFPTLSLSSPAPASSDTDAHSPDTSSSHDLADVAATDGEGSTSSSTSASTASLLEPQRQQQQEGLAAQTSTAQHQTLFTRLQSSFSPDFVTSLRDTIPDSVRQAQGRMDLAQQVAQARMQDAATRGEELLRGASIFLRDAVRVVPPEQGNTSSSTPTSAPTPPAHEGTVTPRAEASTSAVTTTAPPATRRDALLHSLRANPAILRVDPAGEERSGNLFLSWTKAGADAARDETQRQAELVADDGVLANTRSVLGELVRLDSFERLRI